MSIGAVDRAQRIREELDRAGRVRVVELASDMGVSEMTIRRDLDDMAEDGLLQRVHGGAIAVGPQPFAKRLHQHGRAKERIAAKLVELVGEGGAIGIDASTTMQRLIPRLQNAGDLTVLTNGLDSFAAMQGVAGVTALLTGGRSDARTGSLVGPLAVRATHDVLLRRLFVSAAAVDPHRGSSEATLDEAEIKLAMADVAAEVVLAVDSSKLGQRAPAAGLGPERVAMLVTELDPADRALDPYRERWTLL
ncbi:DeoR/GlpR family DNA-binding transcription regulator [Dermatobacter hominis]|uniref:DeoR/GlpR family DNA-binding transcription regulator n=1 Tax=Dermatobacter hominis TaxID=2884263 RepID=UPI001D0F5D68|nr:DeoR/GlpR family DNA-binding transcription regulator [Dermatobacter hominis]UDY34904.1 DeoR/GlpR family DNA-binding transcription regulator [Dermatobacter hominis]